MASSGVQIQREVGRWLAQGCHRLPAAARSQVTHAACNPRSSCRGQAAGGGVSSAWRARVDVPRHAKAGFCRYYQGWVDLRALANDQEAAAADADARGVPRTVVETTVEQYEAYRTAATAASEFRVCLNTPRSSFLCSAVNHTARP
jgi:hypothetical protein